MFWESRIERLAARRDVNGLARWVAHDNFLVAQRAVEALAAIGDASSTPVLVTAALRRNRLGDETGASDAAVAALAAFGDARAIPTLVAAMDGRDQVPRTQAAEGLQRLGWQPVGIAQETLFRCCLGDWEGAAAAGDAAVSLLIRFLPVDPERVAVQLVRIGSPRAAAALGHSLMSAPLADRAATACLWALARIGGPIAREVLVTLVDAHPLPWHEDWLAPALAEVLGEDAVPVLRDRYFQFRPLSSRGDAVGLGITESAAGDFVLRQALASEKERADGVAGLLAGPSLLQRPDVVLAMFDRLGADAAATPARTWLVDQLADGSLRARWDEDLERTINPHGFVSRGLCERNELVAIALRSGWTEVRHRAAVTLRLSDWTPPDSETRSFFLAALARYADAASLGEVAVPALVLQANPQAMDSCLTIEPQPIPQLVGFLDACLEPTERNVEQLGCLIDANGCGIDWPTAATCPPEPAR